MPRLRVGEEDRSVGLRVVRVRGDSRKRRSLLEAMRQAISDVCVCGDRNMRNGGTASME